MCCKSFCATCTQFSKNDMCESMDAKPACLKAAVRPPTWDVMLLASSGDTEAGNSSAHQESMCDAPGQSSTANAFDTTVCTTAEECSALQECWVMTRQRRDDTVAAAASPMFRVACRIASAPCGHVPMRPITSSSPCMMLRCRGLSATGCSCNSTSCRRILRQDCACACASSAPDVIAHFAL